MKNVWIEIVPGKGKRHTQNKCSQMRRFRGSTNKIMNVKTVDKESLLEPLTALSIYLSVVPFLQSLLWNTKTTPTQLAFSAPSPLFFFWIRCCSLQEIFVHFNIKTQWVVNLDHCCLSTTSILTIQVWLPESCWLQIAKSQIWFVWPPPHLSLINWKK